MSFCLADVGERCRSVGVCSAATNRSPQTWRRLTAPRPEVPSGPPGWAWVLLEAPGEKSVVLPLPSPSSCKAGSGAPRVLVVSLRHHLSAPPTPRTL